MRRLRLVGRRDVAEAAAIEATSAGYCAVERGRVVVRMGGVEIIFTTGIRMQAFNAKALARPAGTIVLPNPTPRVGTGLEMFGIPSIVLMYHVRGPAVTLLLGC
jgi:anti-anti-sigma regulatory factor